ncbi:MAG: alcohol dehydrogenase catalytic domain-containing protein [Limnochordales bacterium]|nr:alcohol dehydrogenase catalytic domain-containing protein [Limnochordales bacterium]
MLAVVVKEPGQVVLEERPRPVRPPGCALIRVTLAGVCQTDLELVRGYMGFTGILGHEFVGVVEEADDARWVGRRVVGEITVACGHCDMCRRGLGRHCRRSRVLGISGWDGAFAQWMVLPEANLHPVPEEVPDRRAVFTEPLAAALEILEQVPVGPADRVAVVGDGRLGLLCAQVLALYGAQVVAVGRHRRKLALLAERGIETLLAEEVPAAGLAGQLDVVVECTGRPGGLAQAAALVRPRGTLVLKTTVEQPITADLAPLVVREVTVVGSRCGPFPPALRLLARGQIATEPMVDAEFPLERGDEALARAAQPGVLKVLLRCG